MPLASNLYYRRTSESLAFASEPRALMTLDHASRELDFQAAYDYLVHGHYDHTERSFVKDLCTLPPAHTLTLSIRTGQADVPNAGGLRKSPSVDPPRPMPTRPRNSETGS